MTNIDQSQLFFFISSLGFIILGSLGAIVLVYVLRIIRIFERALDLIGKKMNSVEDVTIEMLNDLRESALYRLITFKGLSKAKKNNKKHE